MALDVVLELSVEQLISALNKKLFIEFTDVRSKVPPVSRTSVAALTAEVRSGELKISSSPNETFLGRCSRETSQRRPTRSDLLEKRTTTGESPPPRSHRAVRRLCLRCRSEANHSLDPRVSVLAQSHHFQSQELGIDQQWMEAFGPFMSRTISSGQSVRQDLGIGYQGGRRLPSGVDSSRLKDLRSFPDRVLIY